MQQKRIAAVSSGKASSHPVTLATGRCDGQCPGRHNVGPNSSTTIAVIAQITRDKQELLAKDAKLRIVLKEFPFLSRSIEAARFRLRRACKATRANFKSFTSSCSRRGGRPIKRALSQSPKRSDLTSVVCRRICNLSEVTRRSNDAADLGNALAINGTPTYVVGQQLVVGAIGAAGLARRSRRNANDAKNYLWPAR